MTHILLVHIGIPKTGTTALQNFLVKNSQKLEEYGWSYPDLYNEIPLYTKKISNGEWINANNLFPTGIYNVDFGSEEWKNGIDIIHRKLDKYNVILSSETIFSATSMTEKIMEALKKNFDNTKVVIYVRRQDLYIESRYNQKVKSTIKNTRIDDTIKYFYEGLLEAECNYIECIKLLEKIFGKENIIIRVYEKGQLKGKRKDVLTDFLDVLQLPEEEFIYDLPMEKTNERISGNYFEIKRLLNSVWENDMDYSFVTALQVYSQKNKNAIGYLKPKEREKILNRFAVGNEQLAKQYLGRKDGILFYDTDIDIPFYESPYEEKDLDIIKVFGTIVSRQDNLINILQKKINALEKSIHFLQENFLETRAGKRKLVYFGAGDKGRKCLKDLSLDIKFMIDNDKFKDGTELMDVRIVHAEKVTNWNELFIIITVIKSEEIEKQLEDYGLIKEIDYVCAKDIFHELYE